MPESATAPPRFAAAGPLPREVDFLGGRLTGDGGSVWLAEVDAALGLCAAPAAQIPERRARRCPHDLRTLPTRRVSQIACGYEDQHDAGRPRVDPPLKQVRGRLPETGADPASQPTTTGTPIGARARTGSRTSTRAASPTG